MLFTLDPERAHDLIKHASLCFPSKLISRFSPKEATTLQSRIGHTEISNPVGLAAGFDKNGEMIDFMRFIGFGFEEVGSVTDLPCEGRPKPRIFRLPKDESLINRMGLPNLGAEAVAKNLSKKELSLPIGINIAGTPGFVKSGKGMERKTGIEDILSSVEKLSVLKAAYYVLNLSCPNTPDGRTFEEPNGFCDLAKAVSSLRKEMGLSGTPILIKLSPNLDKAVLRKIVDDAVKYGIDGFVVGNTDSGREGLKTPKKQINRIGEGGVSGKALANKANNQLKNVFEIVGRNKILMGVGGIMSDKDLIMKLSLGASFFQVYTGLIYRGPMFVRQLKKSLDALCKKIGVLSYRELVGSKEIVRAAL